MVARRLRSARSTAWRATMVSRNSVSTPMASAPVRAQRWNSGRAEAVSMPPFKSIIHTRSSPSRIMGPTARSGFHISPDLPAPVAPTPRKCLPRMRSR